MKIVNRILLSLAVVLGLASCQKDPITSYEGDKVCIEVDASKLSFGDQTVDTRSTELTVNEKTVNNAYAYLFDSNGDILQRATGSISSDKCSFEFDTQNGELTLVVLANLNPTAVSTSEVEDGITLTDLRNLFSKMPFTGPSGFVLSNAYYMYYPLTTDEITLPNGLSRSTVPATLAFKFAYARIIVSDSDVDNADKDVYSYKGYNVPKSPGITSSTPLSTNYAYVSSGVGFYLYPTVLNNTEDNAVYIILKVKPTSSYNYTYHKVLFCYDVEGLKSYDVKAGTCYKLNINSLTAPGYSTEAEAIAAPPANIDYDIIVEGNSSSVIDNGQYYIGSLVPDYWVDLSVTTKSHMIDLNFDIAGIVAQDKSNSWVLNPDGSMIVDVEFEYNVGEESGILISDLTREIVLPTGVTVNNYAGAGYNTLTNWDDSFGKKKLRLNIASTYSSSNLVIKIGELTKNIPLTRSIITDYSDYDMVNDLVKDTGDGRFSTATDALRLSNCYMLTPHSLYGTVFYIPITDRINEYWNDYANDSNFAIKESVLGDYEVEIIRKYPDEDLGVKVEKLLSPISNKSTIKVTLPPSKIDSRGAMFIAVKKGGTIIWSWYLWVTDYNPYNDGVTYDILSNSDTGTRLVWMDRNLGASNNTVSGSVYQWGKKEPISSIYYDDFAVNGSAASIAEAIKSPLSYYYGRDYSSDYDWCGSSVDWDQDRDHHWRDKKLPSILDDGDKYTTKKSIFDPSPLGFMVPCSTSSSSYTSPFAFLNSSTTSYTYGGSGGLTYKDVTTPILFHNTGRAVKKSLENDTFTGYYWSAPALSSTSGCLLDFSRSVEYIYPSSGSGRYYGCEIRSIKELE